MEGHVLIWEVTNADTAIAGSGTVELMGLADGKKKLSAITKTYIRATTTGATTEPPEPAQPWVDQVLEAAERAEAAAERAESAGGSGGSAGGIVIETDPTVHDWAKQPQKPTYTADEVNAIGRDELPQAIEAALAQAKESGEFDGAPGPKGDPGKSGVHYGPDEPTDPEVKAWINPEGEADKIVLYGQQTLTEEQKAQARNNIGAAKHDGEYELIEAFVTDKDVSAITRSQEPNGDKYNFKKIYVDVKTPQGSEKKVGIASLNGRNVVPVVYLNGAIVTNTEGAWCKIFAHIDGNVLRGEGQSSANGSSQLTWNNGNIYMRGFGEIGVTYIDYFQFTILSGVVPAGTVFEIYGVRT